MTPEELNRAKDYAQEKYADPNEPFIEIDGQSTEWSELSEAEAPDGVWIKAWLFVPREAYQGDEAGSPVVPGG